MAKYGMTTRIIIILNGRIFTYAKFIPFSNSEVWKLWRDENDKEGLGRSSNMPINHSAVDSTRHDFVSRPLYRCRSSGLVMMSSSSPLTSSFTSNLQIGRTTTETVLWRSRDNFLQSLSLLSVLFWVRWAIWWFKFTVSKSVKPLVKSFYQ